MQHGKFLNNHCCFQFALRQHHVLSQSSRTMQLLLGILINILDKLVLVSSHHIAILWVLLLSEFFNCSFFFTSRFFLVSPSSYTGSY